MRPAAAAATTTASSGPLGWPAIALATAVVTARGRLEPAPPVAAFVDVWPQFAYITFVGVVVAVLTWNSAVGLIGPQNAALLGNPIPITTFAIEIGRGYRPNATEVFGMGLAIGGRAPLPTCSPAGARRRMPPRFAAGSRCSPKRPERAAHDAHPRAGCPDRGSCRRAVPTLRRMGVG